MDFDYTEQQNMLKTMAMDFLSRECPKVRVRELEKTEIGYDPEVWAKMVELGWQGLIIPEQYGGMGAEFLDLIVLMEEMGRNIFPSPFFSTIGLCTIPLIKYGNKRQKSNYLPLIASGKNIWALAIIERSGFLHPAEIKCEAVYDGDDYIINGEKWFSQYAHVADWLIVICRTGLEEDDITAFIVSNGTRNIKIDRIPTIAGEGYCRVRFKGVKVSPQNILGRLSRGWKVVEYLTEYATVLKCAEVAGACRAVLDMTGNYAKERIQFEKPIGSFMAVQHKLVDMLIEVEGLQYLVYQAAWLLSTKGSADLYTAIAKAKADEVYQRVCIDGIKIHGAIGFTMDHDIGCYFRRVKGAEFVLGDREMRLDKIARNMKLE